MKIVIIGNGIAGITAARYLRKLSDHQITVISAESPYFFSRTALMYVYMGDLRWQDIVPYETSFWTKNRIDLRQEEIINIDVAQKKVIAASGVAYSYDKLILATGSKSNRLGLPGEEASNVSGLYSAQDLHRISALSSAIHKAIIIGGGLIGIELAQMLRSRGKDVTMLVREDGFMDTLLPREESDMINDHIRSHGVDLRLATEAIQLNVTSENKVSRVTTTRTEEIPCDFVGMTIGVSPNIDWLKDSPIETGAGIKVDAYLRTHLPDIYAIGDCAEIRDPLPGRSAIEPLWYTGRIMGETLARTLAGQDTPYDPGIWFNSAKFFDIEYQVYGDIRASLPEGHQSLFYQAPGLKRSIRINYLASGEVIGFNLLGTRFRQAVCEKWIRDKAPIEHVLSTLELAVFDPEFSSHDCAQIRDVYARLTNRQIKRKAKPNYNLVHRFLHPTALDKT